MRKVELVKGITSSALGFGCAPILGAEDSKRARRALECALEYGITHFDLARSYGYGEAESFVGNVIKGRRSQLVLASKFGIQANWKAKLLKPLKPLVRLMRNGKKKIDVSHTGQNTTVASKAADRFHDRIPLRGIEMRRSLEQSLRALNTDYLDYFFIHEPLEAILYIDELTATAQSLKTEGKIRAWGLAYMRSQEFMHKLYLNQFDVLQFDNSFGAIGYKDVVKERGVKPNVLFSPLRGGINSAKPVEKLQKLFSDFPKSVVLCSMFNEKHLRENVNSAG